MKKILVALCVAGLSLVSFAQDAAAPAPEKKCPEARQKCPKGKKFHGKRHHHAKRGVEMWKRYAEINKQLKEKYPQACKKVGLYGLSMGGMVAICEAAQNPEIACVVSEASFYSFRRVVTRWAWVHKKVPYLPLIPIVLHYIRKELNANPEHFSPRYNVSRISPRPIFIIHGRYDNLVPAAQAKMLYRQAGQPKQLWLVPKAKHNKCAEVGGFEYKQRLADFFKKYL